MKYMAFSREIIKKVLQYVQFRVPATEEKDSYYTQIGDTLVRLSNHCTRLYVWDDILEKALLSIIPKTGVFVLVERPCV